MEKKTGQIDASSKKPLLFFLGGMLLFDIIFLAFAVWRFGLWWNELLASAAMLVLLGIVYTFQISKIVPKRFLWLIGLHVLELIIVVVSYEAEGMMRPITSVPILVSIMAGGEPGIMALIFYSVVSAIICADPTEVILLYLAAGVIGILLFSGKVFNGKMRIREYIISGIGFLLSYVLGSFVFALYAYAQLEGKDIVLGLFGGALQLLPVICFLPFLIEGGLRLPGAVSLASVVSIDFPALVEFKEREPVLFKHSRLVARLSSQAAAEIGSNAMLAEAGGLYHEIGNGLGEDSEKESLAICKQYRIPAAVQTIVKEHDPDKKTPSSKEAAIVMLSDTILHIMDQNRKREAQGNMDIVGAVNRAWKVREDSGAFLLSGLSKEEASMLKEYYIRVLGRG